MHVNCMKIYTPYPPTCFNSCDCLQEGAFKSH